MHVHNMYGDTISMTGFIYSFLSSNVSCSVNLVLLFPGFATLWSILIWLELPRGRRSTYSCYTSATLFFLHQESCTLNDLSNLEAIPHIIGQPSEVSEVHQVSKMDPKRFPSRNHGLICSIQRNNFCKDAFTYLHQHLPRQLFPSHSCHLH